MNSTIEILRRCCEKLNLKRVVFNDKKLPTSIDNIIIFPFFGDARSSFILSSLILRRIKEESKSSKYFILLSWPGNEALFPYVDEYWTMKDEFSLEKLRIGAEGFGNYCSYYTLLLRSLNEWFYEIFKHEDIQEYYENGINKNFFDRFRHIKVSLPTISSTASLGIDFAKHINEKELKVFIYPAREINTWRMGKNEKIKVNKEFYLDLINHLVKNNYYPIVYRDLFCYDTSIELNENCIHIWDQDMNKVLASIRSTGFVIDFFSGISRLAICARTPFLCFDERSRYNNTKEYEIDDLCGKGLPKDYIFSFATIISSQDKLSWKSILDSTVAKLNKIFPTINRDSWPSTAGSNDIVPYDFVRKIKNKKFGTRFVKINREEI